MQGWVVKSVAIMSLCMEGVVESECRECVYEWDEDEDEDAGMQRECGGMQRG